MNKQKRLWWGGALVVSALALGGCWSDDSVDPPVAADDGSIPDSAGASSAAFNAYVLSLPAGDESSEPRVVKDSFVAPAEDTSEPQVVG